MKRVGEHRSARTRAAVAVAALLGGGGVVAALVGTAPAVAGKIAERVQTSRGATPQTPAPSPAPQPAVVRHGTSATPNPLPDPYEPGLEERRLTVDGVERTYWFQRPARDEAPLVIGLHGLHGTARAFAAETGLPAATAAGGVAFAVPESVGPAWNDGRLGPSGPDDAEFLVELVDELVTEGSVDPDRVVVAGFSNGAGMTMALAAEHPDVLAGAVAVSGELLEGPAGPHPQPAAAHKVPFWLTHGDADPVQPWAGRPTVSPLLPALLSAEGTVAEFRRANGSADRPSIRRTPGNARLSGPLEVRTWAARGDRSAPVTLYRLPGAGHEWPRDEGAGEGAGPGNYGFSATELVLRVVRTVERPDRARPGVGPAPAFARAPERRG